MKAYSYSLMTIEPLKHRHVSPGFPHFLHVFSHRYCRMIVLSVANHLLNGLSTSSLQNLPQNPIPSSPPSPPHNTLNTTRHTIVIFLSRSFKQVQLLPIDLASRSWLPAIRRGRDNHLHTRNRRDKRVRITSKASKSL